MKILQINTTHSTGGAAKAAYRLHRGLQILGQESLFYTTQKKNGDDTICQFILSQNLKKKIIRFTRQQFFSWRINRFRHTRPSGYELFSDCQSRFGKTVVEQLPESDVINLHWVARFVDYPSFFTNASPHTPIVWTLHDMNPFTGGCHYNAGCEKYTTSCGSCPQLGSKKKNDLAAKIWKQKESLFARLNPNKFHLVAPSKWLAKEIAHSTLLRKFKTTVIPNGLDTEILTPRSTNELRQALDIPADASIILFLADSVENKRKGYQVLLDAIFSFSDQHRLVLLSAGKGNAPLPTSIRHIHLGQVVDERILSMVYSLADVFVLPSLQDNLPNTVMESLACGTPVVAFDVGGAPDMVRNGETGFLVPTEDIAGMKTAIEEIISNRILRKAMSKHCRDIAVKEYDVHVQAKKYCDLYRSLCRKK